MIQTSILIKGLKWVILVQSGQICKFQKNIHVFHLVDKWTVFFAQKFRQKRDVHHSIFQKSKKSPEE